MSDRPRQLSYLYAGGAFVALLLIAAAGLQWQGAQTLQRQQDRRLAAAQLSMLGASLPGWPADRTLSRQFDELLSDPRRGLVELAVSDTQGQPLLRRGRYDSLDLPLPALLREPLRRFLYRWNGHLAEQVLRGADGQELGRLRFRLHYRQYLSRSPELGELRRVAVWQFVLGLLLLGGFGAALRRQLNPAPDWSGRLQWPHGPLPAGAGVAELERRFAEATRQRLGRALDGLNYAVILIGRDSCIRYLNRAAEQLTGWPAGDAQGRLVYSVFHSLGDDGIPEITPAEVCLRDNTDLRPRARSLRARNGDTRSIEVMACLLRDAEGVIDGAAMLFRDMSDSIRQVEELRRQARLSQGVVDHLDEGLLTTDMAGVVRFANARAQRMFGYAREEMEGVTVTKLMPVPFLNTPDVRIGDYIGARRSAPLPKVVGWRKDATTFPAELWVQPMSVDGSSGLVVIVRDVSERLRGENLASRLGRLLDSAMEEIYIFDAQTLYFLDVNRGAQRNLGYSLQQLATMTPLTISEELDAATFQSYLARLRGGDTGHLSYRCRLRRADGSSYPVEVRLNFSREEEPPVFMAIVADISDRQAAEERLQQLAHFDALTGLPNRTVLNDRLVQALLVAGRSARMLGVFFIDLDHFKAINDEHGHEIGDRVLRAAAERLRHSLRSADTVARLGGDEFVILAQGLRTREDATLLAQKILDSFAAPLLIDSLTLPVSASVGVALYPLVETDADGLLRYADSAMYQAKQAGRGRWQLFEAELTPQRRRELELQREIHSAIALNQLHARLQPVIEAGSDAIGAALLGFEWRHLRQGRVGEEETIQVAQRAGVLADLELWCLRKACEIQAAASLRGLSLPPLLVGVSGWQLHQADFARHATELVGRLRVPPAQLILLIRNLPAGEDLQQLEATQLLQELGLRFALQLQALPPPSLRGLPALAMIAAPAALVLSEGWPRSAVPLLACGLADAADSAALLRAGSRYLSGAALWEPLEPAAFEALLKKN
ncbi:MAG TPA: diguanylate cyclase [Solimonas sp.]|nr:diguanylate cyclase [Solimonas sp.]